MPSTPNDPGPFAWFPDVERATSDTIDLTSGLDCARARGREAGDPDGAAVAIDAEMDHLSHISEEAQEWVTARRTEREGDDD